MTVWRPCHDKLEQKSELTSASPLPHSPPVHMLRALPTGPPPSSPMTLRAEGRFLTRMTVPCGLTTTPHITKHASDFHGTLLSRLTTRSRAFSFAGFTATSSQSESFTWMTSASHPTTRST